MIVRSCAVVVVMQKLQESTEKRAEIKQAL